MTLFASTPLALDARLPLTQGTMRRVYEHPDRPDWLIKVYRPEIRARLEAQSGPWQRRLRRLGMYSLYAREIEEYLAAHAAGEGTPLVQKIVGLVETDIGLGIVVEAARDRRGALAPTIPQMIERGLFNEEAQRALLRFIDAVLASRVIVSDLHWRNLVYAYTPERGDHYVMIDGIGSANLLPLKAVFPSMNRRSKLSRVQYLKTKLASALPPRSLLPELTP